MLVEFRNVGRGLIAGERAAACAAMSPPRLSLYRDTSTRGRWSDPRARLNEIRILLDRHELRSCKRYGWPVPSHLRYMETPR